MDAVDVAGAAVAEVVGRDAGDGGAAELPAQQVDAPIEAAMLGGDVGRRFDLDGLAALAGDLLAKDVGILADRADLTGSVILATADASLHRMGVTRPSKKDEK